jgi:hypothetical protein
MREPLLLQLALRCFGAPDTWIGGGGSSNRLCVGIKKDSDGVQSTYHAVGPCGGLEKPSMYMEVKVESFIAVRDPDSYLTEAAQVEAFATSSVGENGYRRFTVSTGKNSNFLRESVNADSTRDAGYAFLQAGAFYGAAETLGAAGAWLGTSSYLLTNGNITTRTNGFVPPGEPGERIEDPNSIEVCTSNLASGSCGAPRTVLEGEFKFSLLGCTLGIDFPPAKDAASFGIRTRVDLVGTDVRSLTLNDGQTLVTIGSTNVERLVLSEGTLGRELTIDFPATYNVGDANPAGFMTPSATQAVQVRVSQVQGEAQSATESIYIDYLFDMPQASGKYVVYGAKVVDSTDPSIFELFSYLSFDPIRAAFVLCACVYFVGCNFFLCTSSDKQGKLFGN